MSGHVEKKVLKNGIVKWKIIVEVSVDSTTGKRNRIYETVSGTKKNAEKRLRDILAELESQDYIGKTDITFGSFLDEWLNIHIGQTHSPNTLNGYHNIVRGYIIPKLGHIPIQKLTTTQLQLFYNEIREASPVTGKPISAKTVKNVHMVIQAALNKAVSLGIIKKNPDRGIQIQKPQRYQAEVYNTQEIEQLVEYAKGADLNLAVHILLCLGLRRGELISLKWQDIDWQENKITISRSIAKKEGKPIEKAPKTESSIRIIDAPEYLIGMLKQARKDYMERKLRYGKGFNDNGYIVANEDGSPYHPDSFSQKFTRFIRKSGLKYIRLHDMRHTNATLMLSVGISPKVAQKRLGHSNFSTTMDIYSHVLDDVGKEAASKIGDNIVGVKNFNTQ